MRSVSLMLAPTVRNGSNGLLIIVFRHNTDKRISSICGSNFCTDSSSISGSSSSISCSTRTLTAMYFLISYFSQ